MSESFILVGSPGAGGDAGNAVVFEVVNKTGQVPAVGWVQKAVVRTPTCLCLIFTCRL